MENFEDKVGNFWAAVSCYTIHGGQKLKTRMIKPVFVIPNHLSKVSPEPGMSNRSQFFEPRSKPDLGEKSVKSLPSSFDVKI